MKLKINLINSMVKEEMGITGKIMEFRTFTTDSKDTSHFLNRMYQTIDRTTQQDPHPGLIIGTHHFKVTNYPIVNEVALLSLVSIDLLLRYVYPSLSGYGKFTISYTMKRSYGEEITFTTGAAIPLTYQNCDPIPLPVVYAQIEQCLSKYAEIYDGDSVIKQMIRVYIDSRNMDCKKMSTISVEDRESKLLELLKASGMVEMDRIAASNIRNRKRSYPSYILKLKPSRRELKPFIVADLETILINNVHTPYAAGLLLVRPGEEINSSQIYTNFSEDHSIILDSFEERSKKVLFDLVSKILSLVREERESLTIYFHNFSRFDGIFLLRHLACNHRDYKLKPLVRNHRLYEISVYSGKKRLFRLRDSLNLLPGSLRSLAKNLCPELGDKGSIPYSEIDESHLVSMKDSLIEYMMQDILLLGGVMKKAQELY